MGAAAEAIAPRDYVDEALVYMEDVLDGRIPASRYIRLACRRQIDDLERAARKDPAFPYRFDVERAERVCRFIELLPHIKGEWAKRKERIRLQPWQTWILTTLFGWVHVETGLRRFTEAYDEVARKNAKTTLAAGVALYMLTADNEPGAEICAAATKREQASIVFDTAAEMARRSPDMRAHYGLIVQAHKMKIPGDARTFWPLDAKGSTQDGLNLHCSINDELHAWKGRALRDVLSTAFGAREQPLQFDITTAGVDRSGVCYETRSQAIRVLEGRETREQMFAAIYTLDKDDDWTEPGCWIKANPNLDVSVRRDILAGDVQSAISTASKRNNVLTKRLNVWCASATAWMDMLKWDACADPDLRLEDFRGWPCVAAIDLATKKDILSRVLWFVDAETDEHVLFARHYAPRSAVEAGENSAYEGWEHDGWLTVTEGQVTDQGRVQADLVADAERFEMTEIVFDRWQGAKMMAELEDAGLTVVDLTNSVGNLSEPMKEFEALVLSGRLRHPGDPVLGWMVGNVCARPDEKSNIFPVKETKDSKNKIDGAVAAIMGLNRVMAHRDQVVTYEPGQMFA